jgi:transcriptional regulator with XRE-family HTH domain
MAPTASPTLGTEIRRLRTASGTTLRGFARAVGVSAPHLSDIEHDRRRPSKDLLKKIVGELQAVGATHAGLDRLDTRFENDLQEWAAATPGVRLLLRTVKESGLPIADVLKGVERFLQRARRTN